MRYFWLCACILLGGLTMAVPAQAITPTQIYAGRFVTTSETPGQVWYVDPRARERVAVNTIEEYRSVLRDRAARITVNDLKRIPADGTTAVGDIAYRRQLAGRFLVVTDRWSETWYILPRTKRRVRIGRGAAALTFIRAHAQLIRSTDLAAIPTPPQITFTQGDVSTSRGTFRVERLTFQWTDPALRITTDTANTTNCGANCPVLSLGAFVQRRQAVAGIHGTYFCPQDYAACAGRRNSFNFPVWNTFTNSWRNGDRIKFTTDPLVAFDTTNRPFLYSTTLQFTSEADFTNEFRQDSLQAGGSGVLQAAFSNGPALIKSGQYVLRGDRLDTKQATVRSARGGLGWQGNTMVLFVAHGATVWDLAAVAQSLNLDNAVNLDGGGSTAMYTDGRYVLGPGRSLPNAILITRR